MKFFKKLILLGALLASPIAMTSCGFFAEEEGMQIKSITALPDEDGNTIITISFESLDHDPVTFTIPKGNDGQTGVGIKEIKYETDNNNVVTVKVYLTNSDIPVEFQLKPGISISSVRSEIDPDTGNTLVYFIDSEGNELECVEVSKGDTGVGIASIVEVPTPEGDGSLYLIITMNDGDINDPSNLPTQYEFFIPAPKKGDTGDPGRGITSIAYTRTGVKSYLTITYTDGESDVIPFDAPPTWYRLDYKPDPTFGENGDYNFDTQHGIIYEKKNGVWIEVVKFSTDDAEYTVTFNLNDSSEAPAQMPAGYDTTYVLKKGEYFKESTGKDIPLPVRFDLAGEKTYVFKGWSLVSSDPGPTNGYYTDMVPIFKDMNLFAIWDEVD